MAAGRSSQDMKPCHLRVVKLAVPWCPRTSNLTGAALKYVVGYIEIEDGYISGQEPQSCMYVCTYTWEQDVNMYHYSISRIFQY